MSLTDTGLLHQNCTFEWRGEGEGWNGPCSKSVKDHKIEKLCFVHKKYLSYSLQYIMSSNYDYMALFMNEKELKPFPLPDLGLNVKNEKTYVAWSYKISPTIMSTNINCHHNFLWESCLPFYSVIIYHLTAGTRQSHQHGVTVTRSCIGTICLSWWWARRARNMQRVVNKESCK